MCVHSLFAQSTEQVLQIEFDSIKSNCNVNNLFENDFLDTFIQHQDTIDKNTSLTLLDSPIAKAKPQGINMPNYFLTESAISLPKGKLYYKGHFVLLHTVNYAITDNVTIGAGMEFISLILGVPLVLGKVKGTLPLGKNFHVGASLVYIHFIPLSDKNFLIESMGNGIYSGVLTYGNEDRNVTVNLGRSMLYNTQMFYAFSGYLNVSNKLGLVTESFSIPALYPSTSTLYGFGVRFNDQKKTLFDLGLYGYADNSKGIVALPYLAYCLKF